VSTAGYSGTPLVKKLGIKPADRMVWLDAPDHFEQLLGDHDAEVKASLRGGAEVVVCFVTERRVLAKRVGPLMRAIAPAGMAWIAWPKKSSAVPTDITEDTIRDVALPIGLVDVKVCAIDETWSGLKLVIRKELR
jgi:hypothetical protein